VIKNHKDMTSLWHDSMRRMWRGTLENGGIDFVASIDTISYDNLLAAESMALDLDLGRDLWLNRSRWTRLVRQYLDPSATAMFLDRAADIGLGEGKRGVVTQMPCASVRREAKKHRWGNCMLGFTYRGVRNGKFDQRPTLAMHSRVSYIAYIGGLDLGLAHVLAREISRRIEVPVEEFRFRWYIDALQFHGFKSLPLLYRREYIEDLERSALRKKYPTIKLVGKWWDKVVQDTESGKPLTEEKYGPLRRVKRRYMEYVEEDYLPRVPVDSLTLAPLTNR
jgi:hypothetical protein